MRWLVAVSLLCVTAQAYKGNPLKTKKYKCVEVAEDEELVIRKKASTPITWDASEMRSIGSARLGAPAMPELPTALPPPERIEPREEVEAPTAHKHHSAVTPAPVTVGTAMPPMPPVPPRDDVPRDAQNRPLILSPEHCAQVKKYAGMYGVRDVLSWVRGNCSFAKMYLPNATCDEINTLVASCYKMKLL